MTTPNLRKGWKILTHDGRSPWQGGNPILNGPLPVTLPTVALDTGPNECAAGWNYVADIKTGWRIAGMWPTGYPSRVIAVEASKDAIERGTKRRASSLTLLREASRQEITDAFARFSVPFGTYAARLADEQFAWWQALGRPERNVAEVEAHLALALSARQLPWSLRRYKTARTARNAWDAWNDRTAWDAWATGAAWAAGAAWDAGDAGAALTVLYARLMGWQDGEPYQYTVGIREAYRQGLDSAISVAPTVLGWAMQPETPMEGESRT